MKSGDASSPGLARVVYGVSILGALIVLTSCGEWMHRLRYPAAVRFEPPSFYLGGIQVHEASHEEWFENLKAQGFNAVQVTEYAKQGDWDTDHLWWEEESPWVIEEIRGAKRAGLHVALVLRVALDHAFERNAFLWHGMIMPTTDEQIASWFEQYARFVAQWAEIAEREGVDVLMIGSEMNALASTLPLEELPPLEEWYLNDEKQDERRERLLARRDLIEERELWLHERETFPTLEEYLDARIATEQAWAETVTGDTVTRDQATGDQATGGQATGDRATADTDAALEPMNARRALLDRSWRQLIASTREIYGGRIGYAANFDQYHEVGFWDALDLMGVNAYFKLRHRLLAEETPESLRPLLLDGWRAVLRDLEAFRVAEELAQPVVFTELGYTWRALSTLEPWSDTGFSMIEPPSNEVPGTVPEQVPGTVAEEVPGTVAEEVPGTAAEEVPGTVPEEVPGTVAEEVPGTVAGEVPGTGDGPEEIIVVWRDQPERRWERAVAVEALHDAHGELAVPFLHGIFYWKLSSHDYHYDDESFMVHIGPDADEPILDALRRFVED